MADLEKVIKGLSCCDDTSRATLRCDECPYNDGIRTCSSIERLHADALELLRGVKPEFRQGVPSCGKCGRVLANHYVNCPWCGYEVTCVV